MPEVLAQKAIESFVSSNQIDRAIEKREIITRAELESISKEKRRYDFHALGFFHVGLERAWELLTDYGAYKEWIPFADRSDYTPKSKILFLVAGIWGYQLRSRLKFSEGSLEKGPRRRRLEFKVVAGHFRGMLGEALLEERPMKKGGMGTLVLLRGDREAPKEYWPPALIAENGAEIALSVTGRKMRSYLEKKGSDAVIKSVDRPKDGEPDGVPKPRRRL